jgi:hypothetical protein
MEHEEHDRRPAAYDFAEPPERLDASLVQLDNILRRAPCPSLANSCNRRFWFWRQKVTHLDIRYACL